MEVRAWSRVFVRGTAVKLGMMMGSLLVLGLKPLLAPRSLSIVAFGIAIYWLMETRFFGRKFKWALKQVIVENKVDFDHIEAGCVTNPGVTSMEIQGVGEGPPDQVEAPEPGKIVPMPAEQALKLMDGEDRASRVMAARSFVLHADPRAVVPDPNAS